jgi:hypothetical protein
MVPWLLPLLLLPLLLLPLLLLPLLLLLPAGCRCAPHHSSPDDWSAAVGLQCLPVLHIPAQLLPLLLSLLLLSAVCLQGAGVHPTTALLMIGVLLSGYSAYLSYTYLLKVKSDGLNVLQGWNQLKDFNDHLVVNFAGAAATLLALQVCGEGGWEGGAHGCVTRGGG